MFSASESRLHPSPKALPVSGQNRARIRATQRKSFSFDPSRLARFLKGLHPRATEAHVAAETGVPAGSVRKHMSGETRPGADHMLAYLSVYGPGFAAAILPYCDWPARAADEERRRSIARELERIGR